jgi:hypothetical protein
MGRKWIPLLGEVLTWEMTVPTQRVPLIYCTTPEDFWLRTDW